MRARDNPFATERVLQLRYQFPSGTDGWAMLLDRLETLHFHAALVGPHGAGKTTLLEDLGYRLKDRGFRIHSVFLNEQDRVYPLEFFHRLKDEIGGNDIILLDGAEQLGALNWYRFRWQARRARGLIITTHRPGRLPVLWHCQTDPNLLADLIVRLVAPSSLPDQNQMRQLYDRHHGNLREALRELYDIASDRMTLIDTHVEKNATELAGVGVLEFTRNSAVR
jgi:MoxR-like ATPase